MKLFSIALLACTCALAMAAPNKPEPYDLENASALFEQFIKDFERNYKDEADKQAHYEAFVKNLETINKQNAGSTSATFGINKFADYTPEERKNMFGLRKQ